MISREYGTRDVRRQNVVRDVDRMSKWEDPPFMIRKPQLVFCK
jgi:hypothetical protein